MLEFASIGMVEESKWRINISEVEVFFKSSTWALSSTYMYGLLTKREVKMAGYWPSSYKHAKKNEANIQPS